MKYLVLAITVFVIGCAKPVPVTTEFPPVSEALLKKCEELKTIEPKSGGTPITDLLKTVVENYTLYHQCSNKVEGWNEWYQKVKNIYDKVGK